MTNLSLSASVIALVLGATACLDQTQGSLDNTRDELRSGMVSGEFTTDQIRRNNAGELASVTLTAHDITSKTTIVNSDNYTQLDRGFALELPGGTYELDVTDPSGHVLESYDNVVVDGDVKLAPQQAAE